MAGNSDDLLISVSTDLTTVKRQLRQLGQDISATTGDIEKRFEATGKGIDRSMSSLQDSINRVSGVAKNAGKEWSGALAEPAKHLDDLRRAYVPVYDAARKLSEEQQELSRALSVGAISLTEYSSNLDRLVLKYDAAAAAASKLKTEHASLAAAERMSATSSDGQSMWNAFAGVGAGSGKAARDAAAVFQAELERMETIAAQQAAQIGQIFAADLDARLAPGTRAAAREAAFAFEAEFARLDEIARLKAMQAGAAFNDALNASFRIGAGRGSAAASASVFDELARKASTLRAQLNPLAAAQDVYNAELAEYANLAARGAIAADELANAQALAKRRLDATTASMGKQGGGIGKGANAFNSANIAAQFQDIAVMAQMGIANPLTIALQQGTQLSAVFNQMGGARDVIKGIGAAFLSIVNPVSLVTIGTIAAGVAAYNYFSASEEGAEATEKALKEQADLIDRVAKKWGDALPAIRAYADEKERLEGSADIEKTTQQQIARVFKDIGVEVSSSGNAINDLMDLLKNTAPTEQIVAMQGAFKTLTETASENKTTVEEMQAAQKAALDLYRSTGIPVFQETAAAIGELIPRLQDTNAEIARLAENEAAAQAINNLQAAIGGISSAKARDELDGLLKKAREGEISVVDLLAELGRISGYAPDVSGIISAFRAVAEEAEAARKATTFTGKESQGGRVRYGTGSSMQLPDNAPTPERAPNREDIGAENDRRAEREARGSRTKAPQKTADDRFFEDIEAIRQRTRALAEETNMVGMSFEAQTKRRAAFDLEQKALKDVREEARKKGDQDWQNAQLSPDQVAKINEVSDAYAKQAETLRITQEAQAELEDWMNLGRSATRGFIDDMLNGATAGEAFANVLGKIGDKLLDLAMNDLFGGGGGGGLGIIGSLFGMGGGGGFKPTAGGFAQMMGIPGYAKGTNFHPGGMAIVGERGPELLNLPRGAQVMPRMPKVAGGGGGGSINAPVSIQIDARGADREGLARVEQQVARLKAEIPARVVQGVRQAQKSNVKLG